MSFSATTIQELTATIERLNSQVSYDKSDSILDKLFLGVFIVQTKQLKNSLDARVRVEHHVDELVESMELSGVLDTKFPCSVVADSADWPVNSSVVPAIAPADLVASIIMGNHRIAAVSKLYENDPTKQVWTCRVYHPCEF